MSTESFTKLFSSITASTVWQEPAGTRLTWITMLAMADRYGRIKASIPGLANIANVSLAECETAIEKFLAPDKYSRTKDHEGRRIEEIEGGWALLNHAKYRAITSEETTRTAKREHMQRVRGEQKANSTCGNANSTVEESGYIADTDTDTEEAKATTGAARAALVIPEWLPADAWQDWHQYRNSRKGWTHKARALSLRTLTELWAQGHNPRAVIDQAIERGWTGLFPVRSHDQARAGPNGQPQSKTLTGMKSLQGMKNGLVHERDHRRTDEAHVLELGPDTRLRLGADHRRDVD